MKVASVVEGHGEVESVRIILRRLAQEAGDYDLTFPQPVRMPKGKIVKEGGIERAVELALTRGPDVIGVVVLIDADDHCAATEGPSLLERVVRTTRNRVRCSVVIAVRELEAWFCGSAASLMGSGYLRPTAVPPLNPETIRDAKGWISDNKSSGTYVSTIDQPRLAAVFSLHDAEAQCSSFAKLRRDFVRVGGFDQVGP